VSFDLYVFPAPAPANPADVHRLMDETEARLEANLPDPAPGRQMQRFLTDLGRRWPSPDADPSASPRAFWPLWQPVGAGTGLNIKWSRATAMRSDIVVLAARQEDNEEKAKKIKGCVRKHKR